MPKVAPKKSADDAPAVPEPKKAPADGKSTPAKAKKAGPPADPAMLPEPPVPKKAGGKKAKKAPDRPVVHPEPRYALFLDPPLGKGEFDAAAAWEQLGCTTDDPGDGTNPLFEHPRDGKVWCRNNTRNRPLSGGNVADLQQRILNRQWRFNGEPFVVGKTDEVLSGQHTMVALVLADAELTKDDADPHWVKLWKDRGGVVSIPKAVCYGVEESDEVVNTIDTGRSRTVGDVLYRSEAFRALPKELRAKAARATEAAVRLLWERAGGKTDAWAPRLNQAEATGFVEDHPSLVKAVQHVLEEYEGMVKREGEVARVDPIKAKSAARLSEHVRPGTAAGLMYLMAAEDDDGERYRKDGNYTERKLKLEKWDKTEEFWTLLAGNADEVSAVRPALAAAADLGNKGRLAVLLKAWKAFRDGKPLSGKAAENRLAPKAVDNGDGTRTLADFPSLEGIDLGPADVPDVGRAAKKPAPPVKDGGPPDPAKMTQAGVLIHLRGRYGERVLAFPFGKDGADGYWLWDEDARWAAKLLGRDATPRAVKGGDKPLPSLLIPPAEWDDTLRVFAENEATVGVVQPDYALIDAVTGETVPAEGELAADGPAAADHENGDPADPADVDESEGVGDADPDDEDADGAEA